MITRELSDILDIIFTKQHNISFDGYAFHTPKQLKGKTTENFYGCLRELSPNCDLGNQKESIIRDVRVLPTIEKSVLHKERSVKITALGTNCQSLSQIKMGQLETPIKSEYSCR